MREDARKAFTFVEMLIVIIVIGILAGLMMISSGSATDKAEETACLNNRKILERSYNIYRISESSLTFTEVLEKVKAEHPKMVLDYGDDDFEVFSGVCPAHGKCAITLVDPNVVVAECMIHNNGFSDSLTKKLYGFLTGKKNYDGLARDVKTVADYFSKVNPANGTLDSTGENYGSKMTKQIGEDIGIDLSNYSWQIKKNGNNYTFYFTKEKISNKINQTVNVTKYDPVTKTFVNGTVKIIKNTTSGQSNAIIDATSFKQLS